MKLIVGLGNPGNKYQNNRHNTGFMALDAFARQNRLSFNSEEKFKAMKAEFQLQDSNPKALLIKPLTYMNTSGEAVQKLLRFYKLSARSLLVVHDEIDLPFSTIRIRLGGSGAGHNGLASIIQSIGSDFYRLRIGIANEYKDKADAADFVLSDFNKAEANHLPAMFDNISPLIQDFINGKALSSQTQVI